MTEIAMRRTGREHERVVCNRATIDDHAARSGVHRGDGAAQHAHSSIIAERSADRRRDIGRRKGSRCDLIQQRLEQMKVLPVYQRDSHRFMA